MQQELCFRRRIDHVIVFAKMIFISAENTIYKASNQKVWLLQTA